MAVERKVSWKKIEVTVDSGAADTVAPKSIGSQFPMKQTIASLSGMTYSAANGTEIKNQGERRITGKTSDGTPITITVQVADVKKMLGSVSRMCDANNQVVFDNDGSYIKNKVNGRVTKLDRRNGVYKFDMWIPEDDNQINAVGQFQQDFQRLADRML